MKDLTLEELEKDRVGLLQQQKEAISQVDMINGAIQFIDQKIVVLKESPKNPEQDKEK